MWGGAYEGPNDAMQHFLEGPLKEFQDHCYYLQWEGYSWWHLGCTLKILLVSTPSLGLIVSLGIDV